MFDSDVGTDAESFDVKGWKEALTGLGFKWNARKLRGRSQPPENGRLSAATADQVRDVGRKLAQLAALNRALEQVSGDLVVFADDDITAPPNWLEAYQSAALKFPSASVFCGPVIPEFPGGTPPWLRCHPIGAPLFFAKFDPRLPEGPIPGPLTESDFPVGANFAVRAKALKTLRFITDLGPSKENGPLYDEDTEFLARLHSEFGEFIFVPGAYVAHHIDARRIEWPELFEKAFHYGRTVAIRSGLPVPPMQLLKPPSSEPDAASIERFEKGCTLNFLCGQMHEFRLQGQRHFEAELKSMLVPLDVRANRSLLSRSALISSTHPEFAVAGNTPDVTSGTIQ